MKSAKYFLLMICVMVLLTSCKAQKDLIINNVDETGNNQVLEDSVLNDLRNNSDLLIAYAVENFAWVRKINYTILVQRNGAWSGYEYKISLMKQDPSQSITPINVNKNACDSLVDYITQTKAWTIKGDNGSNFCMNGSRNCNINDAASARLWIITKKTVLNPSYYAPEFYQRCCPDKDRTLFLSIKNKIEGSVNIPVINDSN